MANWSSSPQLKGFTTNQPSFFTGTNYPYWKTKLTQFLQAINLDLSDIIKDGPNIPSKPVNKVMFQILSKNGMNMIEEKFN